MPSSIAVFLLLAVAILGATGSGSPSIELVNKTMHIGGRSLGVWKDRIYLRNVGCCTWDHFHAYNVTKQDIDFVITVEDGWFAEYMGTIGLGYFVVVEQVYAGNADHIAVFSPNGTRIFRVKLPNWPLAFGSNARVFKDPTSGVDALFYVGDGGSTVWRIDLTGPNLGVPTQVGTVNGGYQIVFSEFHEGIIFTPSFTTLGAFDVMSGTTLWSLSVRWTPGYGAQTFFESSARLVSMVCGPGCVPSGAAASITTIDLGANVSLAPMIVSTLPFGTNATRIESPPLYLPQEQLLVFFNATGASSYRGSNTSLLRANYTTGRLISATGGQSVQDTRAQSKILLSGGTSSPIATFWGNSLFWGADCKTGRQIFSNSSAGTSFGFNAPMMLGSTSIITASGLAYDVTTGAQIWIREYWCAEVYDLPAVEMFLCDAGMGVLQLYRYHN